VAVVTEVVVMVNAAVVLPAATVTVEGSLAADELSLSVTTTPPLGAGDVRVTVPWEEVPPVTLVGLITNEFRVDETVKVTVATLLVFVPSLAM
jgi:hypothetical protein